MAVPNPERPAPSVTANRFEEIRRHFLRKSIEDYEVRDLLHVGRRWIFRAKNPAENRDVLLKMFPGGGSPGEAAARELSLTQRLVDPRMLAAERLILFEGMPILVTRFERAASIERIVDERNAIAKGGFVADPHPWATLPQADYLAKVWSLGEELLDILRAMHQQGVVHRDVKPASVLVGKGDRVLLADFDHAVELGTTPAFLGEAIRVGSPECAPPESSDPSNVIDERRDVHGAGVTIRYAWTLSYRGESEPVRRGRFSLPWHWRSKRAANDPMLAVLDQAVQADRGRRYRDCSQFLQAWQAARPKASPADSRSVADPTTRRSFRVRLLSVLFAAACGLWILVGARPTRRAPAVVGEVRRVVLKCNRSPARYGVAPISEPSRSVRADLKRVTAFADGPIALDLEPGLYLIEGQDAEGGFQEVIRRVLSQNESSAKEISEFDWLQSTNGSLILTGLVIPAPETLRDMAFVRGDPEFRLGLDDPIPRPGGAAEEGLEPYYLDRTEVSQRDFLAKVASMARSVSRDLGSGDFPATHVSFHEACKYAELVGKRLPTEAEYEFAATQGGKSPYPWGDDPPAWERQWGIGPVGGNLADRIGGDSPILGLYSNVAEWTRSIATPDIGSGASRTPNRMRIARGAPWEFIRTGTSLAPLGPHTPFARIPVRADERLPGLGFRCARSACPRLLTAIRPSESTKSRLATAGNQLCPVNEQAGAGSFVP